MSDNMSLSPLSVWFVDTMHDPEVALCYKLKCAKELLTIMHDPNSLIEQRIECRYNLASYASTGDHRWQGTMGVRSVSGPSSEFANPLAYVRYKRNKRNIIYNLKVHGPWLAVQGDRTRSDSHFLRDLIIPIIQSRPEKGNHKILTTHFSIHIFSLYPEPWPPTLTVISYHIYRN